MPDLGPVAGALADLLAPAVKAFLKTTFGMACLAVVTAAGSFHLAAQGSAVRGALATVLALVLCAVLGLMLAVKRAILVAITRGLRQKGVGSKLLTALFDRILDVRDDGNHADRGVAAARTVERLPLAEAELKLRGAVQSFLAAPEQGGGLGGALRRGIERRLLGSLESYTLARFRQRGADAGGIDLILVRDELASQVDLALVRRLDSMIMRVTLLLAGGAVIASVAAALAISKLPL